MSLEFSDDVCPSNRETSGSIRIVLGPAEVRRLIGEPAERYWLSKDEAVTLDNLGITDYTIHQLADGRFALWRTNEDVAMLQLTQPEVWRRLVERRITDDVEVASCD